MRKVIIAFFLLITEFCIYASIKSTGIPFVENYPKEAYHAGTQVWSIDQDENGIMYFGNNSGLLTFDSQSWRLYPVPNRSIVRSVAVSTGGKIYIGCFNDFGFFAPDARGELVYTSLLNKVPVEYRDFGEVWNIMFYKNGIIFHSYNAVFFLFDQAITIISYNRDLHFSFNVNEEYYVKENGRGILKLGDSGLEMVEHSDFFADIVISSIIPYNKAGLLIFTREEGIFLLESGVVKSFETEWQDFFKKHQIYCARVIADEYYILGTVQNGVLIIDKKGKLIQHLNRNRGLQNNTILSLFTDHSDNLWMGLDNGIDFVMTSSPLSYIAHESEVGAAYVVTHKGSDLYIGTNQGLYLTKWPQVPLLASSENDFIFIQGSQGQVWALKNSKDNILVGHDKGTFFTEHSNFVNLSTIQGGWNFIEVPAEPGIMIEGTYTGVLKYYLEKENNRSTWKFDRMIAGFSESCRQIQFDQKGYLWVGHGYRGVYRLKLNDGLDSITEIRHYAEGTGLPSSYQLNVLKFNKEVIVSSNKGIFSYNYEKDSFERNEDLSDLFDNKNVQSLIEDQSGNIWYFSVEEVGILKSNYDGSYSKITKPFNPIQNKLIATYEHVYSIDRSNILFSTEEGVIHFDPNFKKDYKEAFGVAIRMVEILPNTLLYGGYPSGNTPVEIRFKDNGLRFAYSALTYEFSKDNEYSIMLEGFDNDWTEWSLSAEKEYTNLQDGEYRFRVRGRNIYGYENESEPFVFLILPPWYRSPLAYLLYILLFIILIIISVRVVIRKIEKEKHSLHEKQKADLKAREKLYAEEALKAEQEIIKLQNEKLEAENQKNHTELESKTKELASVAMQITYKNELLNSIKQKLIRVSSQMIHQESKKQVNELIKTLEKEIITQDEWERFEVHFDQVHEDFMKKLRHNFIELTPKDLRLCAYLRMNLSSKEVAPLLNISVRGVEISRYRLRKKMGLPRDTNLTDFMMKL